MHSRVRALVFGAQLSALAFATAPALAQTGQPAPVVGAPPAVAAPPLAETAPVAEAPPASRYHRGSGSVDVTSDFLELLRLDAGPLTLAPVVLLQTQAVPYVGKESFLQAGDPAERGGFRLRRARFGFEGKLYDRVPFKVTA
ncbi:MAG: hypothetical protein ACMG6S_11870, partial [Byssovorax sp.]